MIDRTAALERLRAFEPDDAELAGRRHAAVVIGLHEHAGEWRVWITRRTTKLRRHAGQFALPGGRLDEGEAPLTAALRELHEELGVLLSPAACLARLDDYPTRSGYVITPFVVWAGSQPTVRPSADEVAEVHTVTLSELGVQARFQRIPESERPVIQLPLLDTLIHAPTAAVLYQFRELVLHGRRVNVVDLEQPVFAWT